MKILLAGNWRWEQYEESLYQGLLDCDVVCEKFSYTNFLSRVDKFPIEAVPLAITQIKNMNDALLVEAIKLKVDLVFLWAPRHIFPSTVKALKKSGISTVSYQNDDPFQKGKTVLQKLKIFLFWRLYLRSIRYFDLNLFYRDVNVLEAKNRGSAKNQVWMPFYNSNIHKKVSLNVEDSKRYVCDVVFIGHFEDDGRDTFIAHLLDNGIDVKVWGDSTWNDSTLFQSHKHMFPLKSALGKEYSKALSGAKVALCFLSKLNRDEYTRRCFEIPACNTLLMTERTPYLENLFHDWINAVFFDSKENLLEKIQQLITDEALRDKISLNGNELVFARGFDIKDRSRELLAMIKRTLNKTIKSPGEIE